LVWKSFIRYRKANHKARKCRYHEDEATEPERRHRHDRSSAVFDVCRLEGDMSCFLSLGSRYTTASPHIVFFTHSLIACRTKWHDFSSWEMEIREKSCIGLGASGGFCGCSSTSLSVLAESIHPDCRLSLDRNATSLSPTKQKALQKVRFSK
jgi:hypothetical protein